MKIVHLTPALFGSQGGVYGGAERYTWELARFMAKKAPTKLLTFGSEPLRYQHQELEVHVLGPFWKVRGQEFNRFHPQLLTALGDATIVHCHQPKFLSSSIAAIITRLRRRKVYCSDLGGGGWDLSSYINLDRLYHGHLHISSYSQKISNHSSNVPSHVIYGGVDSNYFRPFDYKTDGVVRYIGRIMPHKGIEQLIQALPEHIECEIIGRCYHPDYFSYLESIAIGKKIHFLSKIHDKELVQKYQTALCVVLPSVHTDRYGNYSAVPELLGQTLLEAMACGTPVIGTNITSIPELIQPGINGFLFEERNLDQLRENILQLHCNPSLRKKLGHNARKYVEDHFEWHTVVDRCLQLYFS